MSELIVIGFDNEHKADEVLLELLRKEGGYKINVEDAAVVIRKEDGQTLVKHAHPLTSAVAAHGSFWGLLIGALLLNPLAGVIVGGVLGGAVGSLEHIGIEDEFIKSLGEKVQPGNSILFILERDATPGTVFHELKKFDGQVLQTSFGFANEQKLKKALEHKETSKPKS
jgi:uncharacterized membrane protein